MSLNFIWILTPVDRFILQQARKGGGGGKQGFSKINYVFSSRRERGRPSPARERMVGLLVVFGLTALSDNISVYIGPSPKEREKEEKG